MTTRTRNAGVGVVASLAILVSAIGWSAGDATVVTPNKKVANAGAATESLVNHPGVKRQAASLKGDAQTLAARADGQRGIATATVAGITNPTLRDRANATDAVAGADFANLTSSQEEVSIPAALHRGATVVPASSGFGTSGVDCNTNGQPDSIDVNGFVFGDTYFAGANGGFQSDTDGQRRADDFLVATAGTANTVVFTGTDTVSPEFTIKFYTSVADAAFPPPDAAGAPTPRSERPDTAGPFSTQVLSGANVVKTDLGAGLFEFKCTLNTPIALTAARHWISIQRSGNDGGALWGWSTATNTAVGFRMRFSGAGIVPEVFNPSGTQTCHRFKVLNISSADVNGNGIPDECEDCNTNGIVDIDDIANMTSLDCNNNGSPDECELLNGSADDCDSNGIPDDCQADCNTNGVNDICDIANGTSDDCNLNDVPDQCDVSFTFINSVFHNGSSLINAEGGSGPGITVDDFTVTQPVRISNAKFQSVETLGTDAAGLFGWNGTVIVELFPDTGGNVPAETSVSSVVVPATRTDLGLFGATTELFDYVVPTIDLEVPTAGHWWINIRPVTNGATGLARWARGETGVVTGTEGFFRSAAFGVPTFTSTTAVVGAPWGFVFTLNFAINDCNANIIPDDCDIAGPTSNDVNSDGIPDECGDCNTNDIPDVIEPGYGDCNLNGIADFCDILSGAIDDCNSNGVPDNCEPDCNANGIADECDIDGGGSDDCDMNGVPDDCQADCNTNGFADVCDIAGTTSDDCNTDGVADDCQFDCNTNGVEDSCDAGNTSADCNENMIPDECEIGFSDSIFFLQVAPGARVTDIALEFLPDVTLGGSPSDPTPFGGGAFNVRAADFDLVRPSEIDALTWIGGHNTANGAGDGSGDAFLISFWDHDGGVNEPGNLLTTDVVDTASGTMIRIPFLVLGANSFFQYVAVIPQVDLPAGRSWVEIFYTGNAGGTWIWGTGSGNIGSPEVFAGAFPEVWAPSGVASGRHHLFALFDAELDCNTSGIPDECELETEGDCNSNGLLDVCEPDCDTNGIADACEIDCNNNGIGDACDIDVGTSADVNTNDVPDECEDCNNNGVPDSLDVVGGTSTDCDANGTPDECELDCNANGVTDACDIAGPTSEDCNMNGIPDECDIGLGFGLLFDVTPDAAIPDGGSGQLLVSGVNLVGFGTGPISDVDICVNITHTWDSDLTIAAVHEGTIVNMAVGVGADGNDFLNTCFDDEAGVDITAGAAPFAADFRPLPDSLSDFDGGSPSGVWQLVIVDNVNADTGSLLEWALFVALGGGSDDLNTNGIPDECETGGCATCDGDVNGDGFVDGDDIQCYVECLITGSTSTCTSCDCAGIPVVDFVSALLAGPTACP